MSALCAGQAVGQFLLNLGDTWPALPFIAASILLSLAVIPVALTRIPAPSLPEGGIMRLTRLYRTSPLGFVGAAVTGVMMGRSGERRAGKGGGSTCSFRWLA